MNRQTNQYCHAVLLLFVSLVFLLPVATNAQNAPVSKLGQYEGYSQPMYDSWVRSSQYVTVRDGTKLAVDILRPVLSNGAPVETPLPVIWTHHRYQRAFIAPNGTVITQLWQEPWLETVLGHGYVIGVVDVRGGGASYGTHHGDFSPEESRDAYDITEWFAVQPWSNGRIGMYGRSYLGVAQYMAAGTAPPHLVAIFPEMAIFDYYPFAYPGGVFRHAFFSEVGGIIRRLDTSPIDPTVPVDEDWDGVMVAEAQAGHWANTEMYPWLAAHRHRDSLAENEDTAYHVERSPMTYLEEMRHSGIAVYHLTGWKDMAPQDALAAYCSLDGYNPQKIVIGPWRHRESQGLNWADEHLRWYDFWLKGVDNGVMDEAPIHYYTMGAAPGDQWRSAWQWPLPNVQPTRYYFQAGPSGTVASANDGLLGQEIPADPDGRDEVTVDYTTTTGRTNGFGYPEMTANDEKGLTYTTPPLESDVELTGHPVVHLWVSSTAADGDFFVYLEEVEASGGRTRGGGQNYDSHYVTEGTLRASHRSLSTPPYDGMGLPYHRSFAEDIAEMPIGEPVELIFALQPTSIIFDKGHRIRVTITGTDRDNLETPVLSPAPTVSVYRNADYACYIVLPIIPADPQSP